MTSIQIVSGSIRHLPAFADFPVQTRVGVIRDAAATMFYFTAIAIMFALVLMLTTGTHP